MSDLVKRLEGIYIDHGVTMWDAERKVANTCKEAATEIARQDAVIERLGDRKPINSSYPHLDDLKARIQYATDNRSKSE